MQVSVTIGIKKKDINDAIWLRAQAFNISRLGQDPEYRCHMCLEKGGQENHVYVQGVMEIFSKSSNKINNDLKTAMKGLGGTLPPHLYVCVRQLTGIVLGSLGYCQKDRFKDHYTMHQVGNIIPTPVVMQYS